MMKLQANFGVLVLSVVSLAILTLGSPVRSSSHSGDAAMGAIYESNEESLNRFMSDASYRAGYERAVYDLYAGRFQDVYSPENA